MIKAVYLDLDGTTVSTIPSLAYSGNRALESVGLKGRPEEEYKYFAGDGARNIIKRALKAAGDTELTKFDAAFAAYSEIFKDGCLYHVSAYDGMKEFLDTVKAKGIKIAVISNKQHPMTKRVIETVYGQGYFDAILGQMDSIAKKPDPEGCHILNEHFGIAPADVMYVGDTNTDMMTGKNARAFTVGVTWGFRPREELEECRPDAIVDAPLEMLHYIGA